MSTLPTLNQLVMSKRNRLKVWQTKQQDAVEADDGGLEDFELDMEVEEMQGMNTILVEFTTIGSMLDVVFVMTEKFNTILNSCSGVFEL